jgi:hypothetical protein
VDPIFPVDRIPPHRRVVLIPSVLPVRDRSKREEVVQRCQFSDRGEDDTHIHGHTVRVLHTAEVDDQPSRRHRRRRQLPSSAPLEPLNIAQHETSVDEPRRIESQRGRYQTILAVKCTVVPSVSRSMVTSCMSACMSWIPRPRWR